MSIISLVKEIDKGKKEVVKACNWWRHVMKLVMNDISLSIQNRDAM